MIIISSELVFSAELLSRSYANNRIIVSYCITDQNVTPGSIHLERLLCANSSTLLSTLLYYNF